MDKAQAVIKGATVTINKKATGLTRTISTSHTGAYRFELLPAGKYDIKVNASWFASAVNAFLSYAAQSNFGENDQSGATNDLTGGNFAKNELQVANVTLDVIAPRSFSGEFGAQFSF